MFAYCLNNPVRLADSSGSLPYDSHEFGASAMVNQDALTCMFEELNIENLLSFFGVSTIEDLPCLPDGCMVFMENVQSFTIKGLVSCVCGTTIVMDSYKYCIYNFYGVSVGQSVIPIDYNVTKGYVYNMNKSSDYEGFFMGGSTNLVANIEGGAIAPNGVWAEIIQGHSFLSASLGTSFTYYIAQTSDWVYGSAPITWYFPPNSGYSY